MIMPLSSALYGGVHEKSSEREVRTSTLKFAGGWLGPIKQNKKF